MSIDRTNFNALVDDDGTNTTGSIWNKNQIKNVLLDPIDAFVGNGGLWTPYAPVWAGADGFGPVLGNGTLSGRFLQIGNWIDVAIVLYMGTTTSYGTSSYWYFTLPFSPKLATVSIGQELNLRVGLMSGPGAAQPPAVGYYFGGVGGVYLICQNGAAVSPVQPFAWSAGGIISVRGSYERT